MVYAKRILTLLLGSFLALMPAAAGIMTPGQELITDLGGPTYLLFNGSSWQYFLSLDPEQIVAADLDGNATDDLVIDFGFATYVFTPGTGWRLLTTLDPVRIAVGDLDDNGRSDLIVDFGSPLGTWIYYNGSTWRFLTTLPTERIVTGDLNGTGLDDVIVDTPGGVWVYYDDVSWRLLTTLQPEDLLTADLNRSGRDELVMDVGGPTYVYYDGFYWTQIAAGDPQGMASGDLDLNGHADVVFDFGPGGISIFYNGLIWQSLIQLPSEDIEVADLDGDGTDEVVFDFGAGTGMYVWSLADSWRFLASVDPEDMTAAHIDGRSCRDLLFCEQQFLLADQCFAQRLEVAQGDEEAHLFRALTRFLSIPEDATPGPAPGFTDSLVEMLAQFGGMWDGSSLYREGTDIPDPLPVDSPTGGEIQTFLDTVWFPRLADSISEDLDSIGMGFQTTITPREQICTVDPGGGQVAAPTLPSAGGGGGFPLPTGPDPVEVDFGDVKALQAGMIAARAQMLASLAGWNLDLDIDALSLIDPAQFQRDILGANAALLDRRASGAALIEAGTAIGEAIDCYFEASNFIRNLDDPVQGDDLFTIEPIDLMDEFETRQILADIKCSILGLPRASVTDGGATCGTSPGAGAGPMIGVDRVDLSRFFGATFDLRDMLPFFNWDPTCEIDYIDTSQASPFPDPTFNLMFPDWTQQTVIDGVASHDIDWYAWATGGGWTDFQGRLHGSPGFPFAGILFIDNESGDFAPPFSVTGASLSGDPVFGIQAGVFPVPLCAGNALFVNLTFAPSVAGQYGATLTLQTDIVGLSFEIPLIGCTGPDFDCNGDGVPDP